MKSLHTKEIQLKYLSGDLEHEAATFYKHLAEPISIKWQKVFTLMCRLLPFI